MVPFILDLLDVHIVIPPHDQGVGHKVILHSRVGLNDVASLPSHIQVVNGGTFKISRTLTDLKGM